MSEKFPEVNNEIANKQTMTKEPRTFLIKIRKILILSLSLLLACNTVFGSDSGKHKTLVFSEDTVYTVSGFEQKKAKRLFYGLVTINKGTKGCADCHYTNYIDTLNWNPSAYDIAAKYTGKNIEELLSVINTPNGKVLPEAHKGYNISEEQAVLLQAYLEELNHDGPAEPKPVINNLLLFIFINLLGVLVIIDLIFTQKIPFKAIHLIILLGATVYILRTLVVEGINSGRQEGYAPEQPIKFSHKIHAGDNKIDCMYCHNLPERSKNAGIPETNVCMNCHVLIVDGSKSGKFEISKISEAQINKTPIEWVKVHNLPDHVFFSHAQHVGAGKLDCAECHGPVEEMDVLTQHSDLSMGWCLDCHRTRSVDFDNAYYDHYEAFHDQIKNGEIDSVLVEDIGGTNCMKCHY